MSSGLLPPVPDLIPIADLRKASPCRNNCNNNCNGGERVRRRDCTPCCDRRSEVMGEQRSRRTGKQPAVDLIDSSGSRGSSAAPQAPPQSRKARSERHRKSDRRREHRKPTARTSRSDSKHSTSTRDTTSSTSSSPERPANPRVNPIFVWVRQEDTRIVDVKCEDYDKRNRILLTKTAQGWRAIPRTETLVPSLKEAADKSQQHSQHHHHHHHHHHKNRKSRKSKIRRKSTAVQVDCEYDDDEEVHQSSPSPTTWMSPVNVESLLPSHTINKKSLEDTEEGQSETDISNVNSVVLERAQSPSIKCSADKICDVSPLDNLLAVAELEFNQQIQSGEWNKTTTSESDTLENEENSSDKQQQQHFEEILDECDDDDGDEIDDDADQKEFIKNMEQLNSLIESCSNNSNINEDDNKLELQTEFESNPQKSEECDYTEDDDNNLAMDDILSRLEQSLRSPECNDLGNVLNQCDTNYESSSSIKTDDNKILDDCFPSDINENNFKSVPEEEDFAKFFDPPPEEEKLIIQRPKEEEDEILRVPIDHIDLTETKLEAEKPPVVESSTMDEEPTDLSIKSTVINLKPTSEMEGPTDLSVPKVPRPTPLLSRPPSQNSEAIQSPQPSGIPAVPQSPDLVSTSANLNSNNKKTVFLESLLTNTTQKIALNSEVTIMRQKEPLDLGKCRKSASPTVTCSQEITTDLEPPPAKKFKPEDITLKNLLDVDVQKAATEEPKTNNTEKTNLQETPRLLELLKTDSTEPDPLTQLRQLLTDHVLNVPDPMLVPKEKLSMIISHPAREIPKLLKQRPELRLPEALAFPHLLHDPDILVITLQQLETIILKQGQSQIFKDINKQQNVVVEKVPEKPVKRSEKQSESSSSNKKLSETSSKSVPELVQQGKCGGINELANDIDAATTAAFNQMMWLPYLNHLEAMSFGNNADVIKMLTNSMPMYPNQVPDLSHFFGNNNNNNNNNRFTPPQVGFPMQPPMNYNNPLELSMWQEAMMQANMLRPKNPFDNFNPKHPFREYLDKITPGSTNQTSSTTKKSSSSSSQMMALKQQQAAQNHIYNNNHPSYQNSFFNLPNSYQSNSGNKHNVQVPQFNPLFPPKSSMKSTASSSSSSSSYSASKHHQKMEAAAKAATPKYPNFYSHMNVEEKMLHHKRQEINNHHRPKVVCKSFAKDHHQSQQQQQHLLQHHHHKSEKLVDFSKHQQQLQTSQPIDLSGSTLPGSKLKVKQHLIDPANASKLLKHDDIPEVGSTTASIEEMQDAHKHLWHPLFGNQKGYNSPWNWTTVTATGE